MKCSTPLRERILKKWFFDSVSLSYLSKDHHLILGAPGLEKLVPILGPRPAIEELMLTAERKNAQVCKQVRISQGSKIGLEICLRTSVSGMLTALLFQRPNE